MKLITPLIVFLIFLMLSCGGDRPQESISTKTSKPEDRAKLCAQVDSANNFDQNVTGSESGPKKLAFAQLRDGLNSACMSCHMAPAQNGGFTYIDALSGENRSINGVTQFYPGFRESAEKMLAALVNENLEKRMPPAERRSRNPEAFLQIGRNLQAWIQAKKPEGNFDSLSNTTSSPTPPTAATSPHQVHATDLGDCIPAPELISFDYVKDRMFASSQHLPEKLSDTDLTSLDAFELAKTGTLAYNVEYPLWADNAEKGRWLHVPMKLEGPALHQHLVQQRIEYDPREQKFKIPDNTRFYKTFYKRVKNKSGKDYFKRIETRLIVVRTPWSKALFGSYRWDDAEQTATLAQTPYRDGTLFKDTIFDLVVDENTGQTRKYAMPAAHRCVECHMGSSAANFILGFTPLQINRRQKGEAGRETAIGSSEASQVARFLKYGFLTGFNTNESLPKLEWSGATPARNIYELQAQSYFVGNCAHCHNPNGFAFQPENAITLALGAGDIFGFNTQTRSTENPNRRIVHSGGDLDQSHIYRKIHDPAEEQGMTSQMPMHTPGTPDCRALRAVGKWIQSFDSLAAADKWEPKCTASDDFHWTDQDFTVVQSDKYIPRRADWDDPVNGMPEKFRNLRMTPAVRQAVHSEFAVGYWVAKDNCRFPVVTTPPQAPRPWMLDDKQMPKRPYGEVYYTTPGSWYFRTSCLKCHGPKADGNSALARGILNWSGGSVRVANFMDGLFGKNTENLHLFDRRTKNQESVNLAGNYMIWMAMEGTRVKFPSEMSNYLGKHGGQMLNLVREKCLNQISPERTSSPRFMDHEIYRNICFIENRSVDDPLLRFDPATNKALNPNIVEDWADRAAANAGWAIFEYLKDAGQGKWRPGNDECELAFPLK